MPPSADSVLTVAGLDRLLAALRAAGYRTVGPTVRDRAIVYDEIRSTADLPAGWTDVQEAGTYRLQRRDDGALFGYNVGPHSWKQLLFPPRETLWRARRAADGFAVEEPPEDERRYAFLAVRACELAAIAVQDTVFTGGPYVDPGYQSRRQRAFVIVVQCGQAAATCFCASMATGPRAASGFDLGLTELTDGEHRFVVEVGSERGAALLAELDDRRPATDVDRGQAAAASARAEAEMGRALDTAGLKERLEAAYEHPHWDDVAGRCLACGNCTMVCPTCFCSTVEDVTDLTGEQASRERVWDSCYTMDFSYMGGGSVRASTRSRYRQWLTHKLASWHDQFGTSGCVGCGRCITWCPPGIDITAEARQLSAPPPAGRLGDGDEVQEP